VATIDDDGKSIPFLRGMLTHYLLEQGFTFLEAYQLADRVRGAIQKKKSVRAEDMIDLVYSNSRDLFGDRPIGNGMFWAPRSQQIHVEVDVGTRPFSREHLSHSLRISGVDEDQAYRISERIEADFIHRKKTVVSRDNILDASLEILKKESGDDFAERYGTWHAFRKREHTRPLIVLIGGASGVGKTSVGVALASLLRISRVSSSDEIRQVMRSMIASDLMPALHKSSYAAWESNSAVTLEGGDPVIHAFREQSLRVCVGIRATVQRAIEENVSLILDGVHLLPDLINLGEYQNQALFVRVNLFLADAKPFKDRFMSRGQEASKRDEHRYLQYLSQILKIQQHILDLGASNNVPAFENSDLDEAVQSISLLIMDTLRKEIN
jgi:2-phosphoglycerate kinase